MGCEQAESFGTTILDEDGLLELIRTKPGKKSKYEIAAEAEVSAHIFIFNHAVKESFSSHWYNFNPVSIFIFKVQQDSRSLSVFCSQIDFLIDFYIFYV